MVIAVSASFMTIFACDQLHPVAQYPVHRQSGAVSANLKGQLFAPAMLFWHRRRLRNCTLFCSWCSHHFGAALCRAEHVINSETEDIPKRVKEITGKLNMQHFQKAKGAPHCLCIYCCPIQTAGLVHFDFCAWCRTESVVLLPCKPHTCQTLHAAA